LRSVQCCAALRCVALRCVALRCVVLRERIKRVECCSTKSKLRLTYIHTL
jgi:hypothetical protein